MLFRSVDEMRLIENLRILKGVEKQAGCKILLAQKAFSMFAVYPLIAQYISGTTASGLFEARLGFEEMKKENHIFSPAYKDDDIDEIAQICDHIIFNSIAQKKKFVERAKAYGASVGLRINPNCSTQGGGIYDPCASGSRLGITAQHFDESMLDGVDGLHFHTLCEQGFDDLEKTLDSVESQFGWFLKQCKWLNLGGGHHITKKGYDVQGLVRKIQELKSKYDLEIYLEPGEAIALNAGYLITEILDIVKNDMDILILDASPACHMPDVLEMPYRPPLIGGDMPNKKKHTYRLSSCTCLAGDVVGDYSFDSELNIGDKLVFGDMAIYSMVKNNTFNGMPLPSIVLKKFDGTFSVIKKFDYKHFKERLS